MLQRNVGLDGQVCPRSSEAVEHEGGVLMLQPGQITFEMFSESLISESCPIMVHYNLK